MKQNGLHNTNLDTGFKTPVGYFDAFEDRLFDTLQEETSTVIPKKEGFKTPEGYFDTIETRLFERISNEEEKPIKVVKLATRKSYYHFIGYAAAIAALVMVVINFIPTTDEADPFSSVVNSEINEFIDEDLVAMNAYDMMDIYEEENIDVTDLFQVSLDTDETINYLENNIDSYNDIFIEE